MTMIQRKFYFPEELYERLQLQAKIERKRITDVLRELIDEALEKKERKTGKSGAEALLELAKAARKKHWKGPKDLSINHDKYFIEAWEESKGRRKK